MNNIFKKNKKLFKNKGGFTLVEFIVSMSIFVILLTIATGIFVKSIRAQRDIVRRLAVIDNAGLALEQMVREIRTGYNFGLSTFSILDFKNKDGDTVQYMEEDEKIKRVINSSNTFLTAPNVSVTGLSFIVKQSNRVSFDSDTMCNPWRVTISFMVGSDRLDEKDNMVLQNTISSRILPVETPDASQELINTCQFN